MPVKSDAVSYWKMVKTALSVLAKKSRKGVSRQAIGKYLKWNYSVDMTDKRHVAVLRRTLKNGVSSGNLQVVKGSYKLSPAAKKETTTTGAGRTGIRKTKVKTLKKTTTKGLKTKKQGAGSVVPKRKKTTGTGAVGSASTSGAVARSTGSSVVAKKVKKLGSASGSSKKVLKIKK